MNRVIQPKTLSDPRLRYSQGIVTTSGKLLFIAGQTASDAKGKVVGKGRMEKTMDLRIKDGMYKGRKTPSYTDYVDNSLIEEAQKQVGLK